MKKIVSVIKKILYILNSKQKILAWLVLFMTIVAAILECLGVSAIIPVINVIVSPNRVLNNKMINSILKDNASYSNAVILVITGIIVLYIFKNLFFTILSWIRIKFSCKIQRELSLDMTRSYMKRGYEFFVNSSIGELARGINTDTSFVNQVLYAGFRLIADILSILLICIFMLFTDVELSLAMVIMAVCCVLIIYIGFKKKMVESGHRFITYSTKTSQIMYETIAGIKDILLFRKQKFFLDNYEKYQKKLQKAQSTQIVGQESPAYIIEAFCVSGLMLAIAWRLITGKNTGDFLSTLGAFAIGAFRILPALGRVSSSINQITTSLPGLESVYTNIKKTTYSRGDILDRYKENDIGLLTENNESRAIDHLRDKITINKIDFSYWGSDNKIFEHASLEIIKGQAIGIIGSSGMGKSTLADIILGLLKPQEGEILCNAVSIENDLDSWSNIVGYVPQSVFLLSGSIRNNVAFGIPENEIDESRIWDSLKQAEIMEFVKLLPDGLDTEVGDRGVRLSGGQRQRIAIARALYRKPEILILDEATSALDNETESAVISAIESLRGKMTLIIIAHRLTTIKKCDVIYEVKDKSIIKRDRMDILG